MALSDSFMSVMESLKRQYRDLILQEQSQFRAKSATARMVLSSQFPTGMTSISRGKAFDFVRLAAVEGGKLQDLTDTDDFEQASKAVIAAAHELLSIGSAKSPIIQPILSQQADAIRKSATQELEKEVRNGLSIARDKNTLNMLSPSKWVLLFLQANPVDNPIKTSREFREIEEVIRGAKYRDQIKPVIESAVRIRDVFRAVNEYQPRVIHFSGHGDQSCLALLDEQDCIKEFDGIYLANLIAANNDLVTLVVLNSCHSLSQAEKLLTSVPHVIGTNDTLPDNSALIFSRIFYSAIAYGQSISTAFNQARIALSAEEGPAVAAIYELRSRSDSDAQKAILVTNNKTNINEVKNKPFTQEEKKLLFAIDKTGDIHIIETDQRGKWVRVCTTNFCSDDDVGVAARFLDALYSLENRGLIRHQSGNHFRLTGAGWDMKNNEV